MQNFNAVLQPIAIQSVLKNVFFLSSASSRQRLTERDGEFVLVVLVQPFQNTASEDAAFWFGWEADYE